MNSILLKLKKIEIHLFSSFRYKQEKNFFREQILNLETAFCSFHFLNEFRNFFSVFLQHGLDARQLVLAQPVPGWSGQSEMQQKKYNLKIWKQS